MKGGDIWRLNNIQTQEREQINTAWQAFRYWSGSSDETEFRRSYLGHYTSRDAFGQQLLGQLGATARLQRLPDWLRAYLRFDGAAVLRDFEQAGHFWVYDAPHDNGGCFVFDAYERPNGG
jgi:antirestriction protein